MKTREQRPGRLAAGALFPFPHPYTNIIGGVWIPTSPGGQGCKTSSARQKKRAVFPRFVKPPKGLPGQREAREGFFFVIVHITTVMVSAFCSIYKFCKFYGIFL